MKVDTDSVLVPLSVFIAVGYHVFLWNTFKHNPSRTSLGIDSSKRKSWFRDIKEVLLFLQNRLYYFVYLYEKSKFYIGLKKKSKFYAYICFCTLVRQILKSVKIL